MRYCSIKTALILVLIFALNYAQIVPCFADAKQKKARVAFAGIAYEDIPSEVENRILERMQELLEQESSFQLMKPTEVQKTLGTEKLATFFYRPDSAAFSALAADLQVDYVFAGRIVNQSREPNRILLVGELDRFDRGTNILNKFEVLKYYDNFGVELVKFKEEFVKTIVPVDSGRTKFLPWLVLGGVTVAGLVALVLSSGKSGAEGQGTPEPVKP